MLRLLTTLAALAALTPARAQELGRKDRLAILYSNQVVFDREGEPLVSVRITEGQEKVRFQSRGALTLLPGADDGARIKAPSSARWEIHVEEATPGRVRYWVAAERHPAGDLERLAERRTFWQGRGHEVKLFEAGALIGLAGATLDTRTVTLGIAPAPSRRAAEAQARQLAEVTPELVGQVLAEPLERPGGWLVAKEQRSGLEVRARDLLWFSAEGEHAIDVPDLEWGHGTPKQGRQDRSYRGVVYVAVGNDGKLAVVNLLSAERLLEGVVPSELYPSAPMAALKAQAVAARGQLLAKIGTRHRSDPYLLCAETHCQVYSGDTKRSPRTTRAVRETRGQLLFDADGLVDTVYSSCCGGHTEAFHVYWGGAPKAALQGLTDTPERSNTPISEEAVADFVRDRPESYCGSAKVFRWKKSRTGAQITKAVNALAPIGPVHTLRPLRRGRSGRALAVEYIGQGGRHVVEGAYANRKLLGRLRSGMWVVTRQGGRADGEPRRWIFEGGGFGHGVGMCQHGAMGMAKQGFDHEAILTHYYEGSHLETAW